VRLGEKLTGHTETDQPETGAAADGALAVPRDYAGLGLLASYGETIDRWTNGFALRYADTSPFTASTLPGQAFLLTNLTYLLGGVLIILRGGDWLKASIIEVAGIISCVYHYNQVRFGPERNEVRIPLLIDYVSATAAIGAVGWTTLDCISQGVVPTKALVLGFLGAANLLASWKWEDGVPYMVFHGFWHLFSGWAAVELFCLK
jgi:hypothetical protein